MRKVKIGEDISVGNGQPLVFFGGPCVIEDRDHLLMLAEKIKSITQKVGLKFVLKTSFDKANRTSIESYRGPGLGLGLEIIQSVKSETGIPVLCDIHDAAQAQEVADVVDVIQIPAFMCRQTDLVCAAAKTGRPVNIKKGQFLSPEDVRGIIGKLECCGNREVLLTERGTSFGYNNLVVDMRSLVIMRSSDNPVIFDATHSLQLPGALGYSTGGQREFISHMARAATAVGIDGLFMEVHDDPSQAPCDGSNMLHLDLLEQVLIEVKAIDELVKGRKWIS